MFLQSITLWAPSKFDFYDPAWREMKSLKRYFLKKKNIIFSETLTKHVKMMPDKVLKVLRRYLPSLFIYRENPCGAASEPPAGRGLNEFQLAVSDVNEWG